MAKSQTLIKSGTDPRYNKIGEGDLVIAFQANRVEAPEEGEGSYRLETNIDWSFDDETKTEEIKSSFGALLGAIEEVFGEKMVTEMIMHYAEDMDHIVQTPHGPGLHLKSKGLEFKPWKPRK